MFSNDHIAVSKKGSLFFLLTRLGKLYLRRESCLMERFALEILTLKKPWDFPGGPEVKNPPCNAGDMGLIPGPGKSHILQSN